MKIFRIYIYINIYIYIRILIKDSSINWDLFFNIFKISRNILYSIFHINFFHLPSINHFRSLVLGNKIKPIQYAKTTIKKKLFHIKE